MRHVLDRRFRLAFNKLSLISHGSTTAWDTTGRGKPSGGNRPPGEGKPVQDALRAAYEACEDNACRLRVCEAAEAAENADREHTAPAVLAPYSLAWKRERANSAEVPSELARLYSISRVTVYSYIEKYRKEAACPLARTNATRTRV